MENINNQNNVDQQSSEQLQAALKNCELVREQLAQQLAYLAADFENSRRRMEKDRVSWTTAAQIEVIKKFLPILDDMDRAFNQPLPMELKNHLIGFELVHKALQKTLHELGVEEITEKVFDPELHEAIMQVAGEQSGLIAQVLQKGYRFKGNVLRPAQVSVVA